LEQKSTTLRPLALRQHFLDFLLRTILYGHFDLARRHSHSPPSRTMNGERARLERKYDFCVDSQGRVLSASCLGQLA